MNKTKILSSFYLIRIDNEPVYVGFTNRDINVRFREHKSEKDLPDTATTELIDQLEFDFGWDSKVVDRNAKIVSDREAELIQYYGTQDSVYQKAIGGGQVWAEIKHFTVINKEDDFWSTVPEDVIIETLEAVKDKKLRISDIINRTESGVRINNVIGSTGVGVRVGNVINRTELGVHNKSVIDNTEAHARIRGAIECTKIGVRFDKIIDNTRTHVRVGSIISHIDVGVRINNVIGNTR